MKKNVLLVSLIGMMLAACSNDPLGGNDNNGGGGFNPTDATRSFLTVTVVPTNGMGTRADEESAPGEYEEGNSSESNVQFVRFFFFDEDEEPAPVWENSGTGGYNSFIDWYPNSSDIGGKIPNETVEKVLHTTLGLVIPSGSEKPASVLAVVNPTPEILALDEVTEGNTKTLYGPSLETLRDCVADYLTGLTGVGENTPKEGNFVMSNSVYVKEDEIVDHTLLVPENFSHAPDDKDASLVTIYVERVLARLDFGISENMEGLSLDNGSTIYQVGKYTIDESTDDNESTNAKDIYVKFLGWNVTGTADKSRLVKSVNDAWTDDKLFGSGTTNNGPWNTADYHRSFWAFNPEGLNHHQYGDFGHYNTSKNDGNVNPANLPMASAGDFKTTYLQENANKYSIDKAAAAPEYSTKVIIAAQLCDETGEPFEIAEWAYHKYTLESLKFRLANNELGQLYSEVEENGKKTYKKITAGDFEFKTAAQLRKKYKEEFAADDADYFVYVVLSDAGEQKKWYLNPNREDNAVNTPLFDAENAADENANNNITATNKYIYNRINRVRVWKKGMTYYYFDVKHLGAKDSPAEFGIVRNHIYRATVTKVEGLGTPVYDPDQIIIPEPNEYEESIVTADVKILQWRIVENDYELVWP